MILRVKGVKKVRAKGRTYYYHRKTMTRLPGPPGSEEFAAKLRALDGILPTRSMPGSLGALIDLYRASPEYLDLAPGSKRQYGKALSHLKAFAGVPLVAISGKRVYELRDQLKTKHSRSAANGVLKLLRILFDWGLKRDLCDVNPAAKVDNIRRPKDAKVVNRRWRDDELEAVLELAPPWLRVAIAIAAYTGMRESDVARVTWNKYNGREFETRQVKTGNPVSVAAHYRLREILDATPRVSPQIVVGVRGRPMSARALGSRFFDWLKSLPAGTLEPGLSFHGLRHTLGTRLAEAGCDAPTIASVLGQQTTQMAEHYSRTARRHHLATAAIERIEERDRNEIGKRSGKPSSNSLKRQ